MKEQNEVQKIKNEATQEIEKYDDLKTLDELINAYGCFVGLFFLIPH